MSAGQDGPVRVDAYLRDKNPALQEVGQRLRTLVKKFVPGVVVETVNPWGIPTFDLHGDLCYFMIGKSHVTFGFPRGTSLEDPHGLLEGTGKNMRHVKLRKVEDLEREGLRKFIEDAARLNRESPETRIRPPPRTVPRKRA